MRHDQSDLTTGQRLIAGACAGITSVACTYPLDLVRTRLSVQTNTTKYRGMWHCASIIYKEEGGLKALFRGLSPTIMGIAPYVALNFTVYETLKSWFKEQFGEPSVAQKLFCGAAAGTTAQTGKRETLTILISLLATFLDIYIYAIYLYYAIATYPLDVIRRRMQIAGMKEAEFKYTSTLSAIRTIAKQEGIRGLYKGMLPNVIKVAPAISVSFVTYEMMKKILSTT